MLLLPWRVQCPGRVWAALAAGLGGRGPCQFSLLLFSSSLPSRPSRCVLQVVPPGCPLPWPDGTPFHAVCAFRGLGPVALKVRTAAYPRRTPPPWVSVARALRAVPVQGVGRAVSGSSCPSAFSAPVPCSAYLDVGGVARSLRPLAWLRVARPPVGRPAFESWLCALGGRNKGARGGRLSLWGWGVRGGAPFHAPPPVLGACGRGLLPTGCGCRRCRCGDPSLTPQRALLQAPFARCGGRPGGGGVSCRDVGCPGLGALPRPTAGPWGVRPGPATHWWVQGPWAWKCVTNPTARALARWLCALWERQKGARGGHRLPGCGASRVGRSPTPGRWSLVRAAGARYPLAVGAGGVGVGTRHLPHSAIWRAGFTRCGGGTRAPRGGASCLGVGRPAWGALPRPAARPWGVPPGPATHWLWLRGMWAWGPVTKPTASALASWLSVLWGRHQGARGGRLLPGCGASVVGRPCPPDCLSSGCAAGARHQLAVGAGGVGVRTRHQPHSASPCTLAFHAEGGAGGRQGGAPLAWVWGVRGLALSHAPPPILGACGRGQLPTSCGCGGCGRWDPSPTPRRALFRFGVAR